MRAVGRRHPPRTDRRAGQRRPLPRRMPRRHERRQVADRAPVDEDPARLRGQAREIGDPPQCLVLGVDGAGALQPRAGIDRGRPHHHVEGGGLPGRRTGDEGQVTGVVGRQAGRRENVGEDVEGAGGAESGRGDRPARGLGQLGCARRPVERDGVERQALRGIRKDGADGGRGGVGVVAVHAAESRSRVDAGSAPGGAFQSQSSAVWRSAAVSARTSGATATRSARAPAPQETATADIPAARAACTSTPASPT